MKSRNNAVEKWGVFETELKSDNKYKNPFTDVNLYAYFETGTEKKKVDGFYDGDSSWKIRFMPEKEGEYTYITHSDDPELDGKEGSFECISPSEGNHGPVKVDKKYHFSYADGKPFFVMGTTAYGWTYRPEEVRSKTLESFSKYEFNKIRMLVFPKYLPGFDEVEITYEPETMPFQGENYDFDFKKYDIDFFRNFEERVKDLLKLGIEADVILFHNYDMKWDIDSRLSDDDGILYIKYLMARISCYRNVWWSLVNEFDLVRNVKGKGNSTGYDRRDWDRIGEYIMENDPYDRLRSIHNWRNIYPNRDWITHASIQNTNTFGLLIDIKQRYGKPAINDEYQYEGNLLSQWGNMTGEMELFRHWLSVMAGAYATHGECYVIKGNKKDIFWTYGGEITGQSAPRLKYMKEIIETLPFQEMEPDHSLGDGINSFCIKKDNCAYLHLLTGDQKLFRNWRIAWFANRIEDEKGNYDVTVYDLWNCCIIRQEVLKAGGIVIDHYPGLLAVKAVRIED